MTGPITYPNGDVAQYLDVCFLARYVGGAAAVSDDENLEVAWFSPEAVPSDLTPSSRLRLEKALQDAGGVVPALNAVRPMPHRCSRTAPVRHWAKLSGR